MAVPLLHGCLWPRPNVLKIEPFSLLLLPPQYRFPSAVCPCTQHLLHPRLPILTISVTLIFIHLILHNCAFTGVPFFFYKTALTDFQKMPLFWLSLTFLSLLSPLFPFPFPLNPWERFGTCLSPSLSVNVPFLTPLSSQCAHLSNPGSNTGPGTLTQVPDGQQCLRPTC